MRSIVPGCGLALALIGGCANASADRDARALAALDLAEASARIRETVGDCAGFTRALDLLAQMSDRALAGLVDEAVDATRARCDRPLAAASGTTAAHQLARARLLDDHPTEALAALAADSTEPAIRKRRAELLDRLGRTADALADLEAVISIASGGRRPDAATTLQRRALQISLAVRAGRVADVARAIAEAPLDGRPALAFRATADAPAGVVEALGIAATDEELAIAVGDRLEHERGPLAALAVRARAVELSADRAEHHDALARSLAAAGRLDDAVAAWERAAAIAPAQPAYTLAPIRALVAGGRIADARDRARSLADRARATPATEPLLTAASAAAASDDHVAAVALAREAQQRRPHDGRLAFTVAEHLAAAGELAAAAAVYGDLLVCGAHGRPWHRHEVAARLVALATDVRSAKLVTIALGVRSCPAIEPTDLASYVAAARTKLDALRSR